VKGTPFDFTAPGGAPLGTLFLDDSFTGIQRNADGNAVIEITDPAANYGLRILALSPEVKAVQVYAPPDKDFVAVEPQFNLVDPFNKKLWGETDTGMVLLQPGQSVSWHIRLELFTPAAGAAH
jgi:galactose mutarotase-like enzyme